MKNIFSSMYWKLAATFLIILILLSAVYLYIAQFTAEMYFQEANQELNRNVARQIVSEYNLFNNGNADSTELEKLYKNVSVINPSIELYITDTSGVIISYFAPDKTIELKTIPLEPVIAFIEDKENSFYMGHDPKDPHAEKTFSAAAIYDNQELKGYLYIILEGEEYINAYEFVFGSYILRLAVRSMSITLTAALIIGLVALYLITKKIKSINSVIRDFKNGNTSARIKLKGKGELKDFAEAYNQMADKIEQNLEELKTMDNLRRELVANVSHDLRTPLAAVQGYLETLILKFDTLSEEERKKYMEIIFHSAERLKKLVEELFELSKLEAREKKPSPEPFSIAELLHDIHQKYRIIAEPKKIDFIMNFSNDLPYVYADISMIERVIQNLIENSIKFTTEGGSVEISVTEEGDNVRVSISDSGCGIDQNEVNTIFDRYNQGKSFNITNKEGLGLGLAIVKKILEVHNTNISVESSEGKGTTFIFSIPIYRTNSNQQSNQIRRTTFE
jgi:signal transduction histidine kinase